MSWAEFWQMGGYARFVWPSYGLVLMVLLWQGFGCLCELRQTERELRERTTAAEDDST